MMAFISTLVSFLKGFQALKELGDRFAEEWVKQDINRTNDHAEEVKEEIDVITAEFKKSETKEERRSILRRFTRIK